jgi:hypothetical protein
MCYVLISSLLFCIDKQRDYFDQISFINKLGSNFVINTIGSVTYNNISYPITKIIYNPSSTSKNKYLVLCGVHGNEPAPVLAISDFLGSISKNKLNSNNPRVDFIYIVNPWGFTFNQRTNGINIDINRDITTQISQEAVILQDAINIKEYTHVFDFHEGNTSGYYMYYYDKNQSNTCDKIIGIYKEYKLPLENEYTDVILQAKEGVIFVPWYAKEYMKTKKTVTTTLWTYDNGIDRSFTIETSKNRNIEERKKVIVKILEEIVRGSF